MPAKPARRFRHSGNTTPKYGLCVSSRVFAIARGAAFAAALAILVGTVVMLAGPEARAQDGERFVSLKAERANLRVGPGRRYPIEWVYTRPGLPLLVIAHFDQWRCVRDHEGTKGWMHKSLLSTRRTVVVMNGVQTMRERPLSGSPAVLRAEAGVIADLLGCEDRWCRVALAGEEGWMPESGLWGTRPTAP